MHSILTFIPAVAALGAVASSLYYAVCIRGTLGFLRDRRSATVSPENSKDLPPVSILKPLKGTDPQMYECFRSHCRQDYPTYEIIFGVHDADDPALESVRRLQREFPERNIRLMICNEVLGANVKVSNLAQMLGQAQFDHLVVNDSDIRVGTDYLRQVIAPLSDTKIGMVTCLYRGIAASTVGSHLEALGISTDFCAGVLAARQIERGIHFGLGSTLAFRRSDLQNIGGFESLVDYLADDYELGKRISDLGVKIELSDAIVETYLPPYSLRAFLSHQLRWARGVRDSRAGGYVGLLFTFGVMWSLLLLVASQGAKWAWWIAGISLLLRFAVASLVGRQALQDPQLARNLWLLPIRDLLAVAIWIASFAGHSVTWRGERYELRHGRLVPEIPRNSNT